MKNTIPGELWNQVDVPRTKTDAVLVADYLSEIAYKLPSVTDVMMKKEFWHTVCEFAERCGALRERITGTIKDTENTLSPDSATFGVFQRFVGAGVDGVKIGFDRFTIEDDESGAKIVFGAACTPVEGEVYSCYADVSVVPDVNVRPEEWKAPRWFLERYQRVLIAGTLMRLQAMPGKPWMDEAGARMNATTYIREINRITHGLITAGMRRDVLLDAESILARQSRTTTSSSQTNTVE